MIDNSSNATRLDAQSIKEKRLISHERSDIEEPELKQAEKELTQRVVNMQRAIQRVDLLAAVCAFATIALALLLFGIVLDCWILTNGLTDQGRLYYAIFWAVSTLIFFISRLVPVCRRQVNVLYAAKVLEDVWQDKYNFTISWLQLCKLAHIDANATELPFESEAQRQSVLRLVAKQATLNAQKQSSETPVDCSSLIRWGVSFAVVVAVCAGYVVFSSKDPFAGAARIVAPLTDITRPQALSFKQIDPCDCVAYQGDFIDITAEIPGAESYNVELLYSSEDGRLTDVSIPMESKGSNVYTVHFPQNDEGLVENLSYRVRVGEGTRIESYSASFQIEVRPQPSFRVEKTTFKYPEYTGLAEQTFENQGEIRALEGVIVTLVARSNTELERAVLLQDDSPTRAQKMNVDEIDRKLASIEFPLVWSNESQTNTSAPEQEFETYTLVSHDVDGQENRDQQSYPVSIIADLPPTIDWESAPDNIVEVPINDVLRVKFVAEDPDFSLRNVQLAFVSRNQDNKTKNKQNAIHYLELLSVQGQTFNSPNGPTPFVGAQHIPCEIEPRALGLSVGDEIEYWGVAYDSKLPEPNMAVTSKRFFRIVEPVDSPRGIEASEEQDEQTSENNDSSDSQNENQNGSDQQSEEQDGDSNSPDSNDENGENEESSPNGENSDQSPESEGESGNESSDSGESESGEESNPSQNNADQGTESASSADGNEQSDDNNSQSGSNKSQNGANNSPNGEDNSQSGSNSEGNVESSSTPNLNESSDAREGDQDSTQPDSNVESSPKTSETSQVPPDSQEAGESASFETILDYMSKKDSNSNEGDSNSNGASSKQADEEEPNQSNGGQGSDSQESNASSQDASDSEEEINPNFDSAPPQLDNPQKKKELPKRTSSERPNENSPVYQADNPDKVDPNTMRTQGDVEETNNYLAQNAEQDTPYSTNPKSDANVTLDPNDPTAAVAGADVDPNATEAKGYSQTNVPSDAPYEIDQDANNPEEEQNKSENNLDSNQLPQSGSSGENSSLSDTSASRPIGDSSGSGAEGTEQESNQNQRTDGAPSNGKSDENSQNQGGGGGSGLGEIGGGSPKLAPADRPRLQYAEEATNLVLSYLEEALRDGIDRELLEELGWTEEQLRDFFKRWQLLRQNAEQGDLNAKEKYLKALNEFEFDEIDSTYDGDPEPRDNAWPATQRSSQSANESLRLKTPDRLTERVRAFTRGVSKVAH